MANSSIPLVVAASTSVVMTTLLLDDSFFFLSFSEQVVNTDDIVPFVEKAFTKMRAYKARPTGYEYPGHQPNPDDIRVTLKELLLYDRGPPDRKIRKTLL